MSCSPFTDPIFALIAEEQRLRKLAVAAVTKADLIQLAERPNNLERGLSDAQLVEELIATTPVEMLAGAAVKLRRLADPDLGIEAGCADDDPASLRHVLAVVERVIAESEVIGFGEHEPRP